MIDFSKLTYTTVMASVSFSTFTIKFVESIFTRASIFAGIRGTFIIPSFGVTNWSETKSPRSSRIDSYIYHENWQYSVWFICTKNIFLNKLSWFFLKMQLTFATITPSKSTKAFAWEIVYSIYACSTIFAWIWFAIIYIYHNNIIQLLLNELTITFTVHHR